MASPNNLVSGNILAAYDALSYRVGRALFTQLGDAYRLGLHRRECELLLEDLHSHQPHVPADEHSVIQSSLYAMREDLQLAETASSDQPVDPPAALGVRYSSGGRGRPRVAIPEDILARLSVGRSRNTDLAVMYDCHPRTIRRRLLDYGLAEPGPPVYEDQAAPDGETIRIYFPGSATALSDLSDAQLDQLVLSIYYQFPSYGRRMFDGYLLELGERVPRRRLEESYRRVVGPTTRVFAPRRLVRRIYNVAGPNSLWHHDGQHGLIRWKIVIHAFIDGFSRYVVGIRASNNNRADTVLQLFDEIAQVLGYPSRVRGDHGGENQFVAARQEEVRGEGRGSYIWGRSVHNIRIERLWVDVTRAFGNKWRDFFRELELHHRLDVNLDSHIWLVHRLFLYAINQDADAFLRSWNHHILARRGEQHLSPHAMYFRGIVSGGQRSLFAPVAPADPDELSEDEQIGYGIDWDEIRSDGHHIRGEDANPFVAHTPDRFSYVNVPDVRCPLSLEQIGLLDEYLSSLPHIYATDIDSKAHVWTLALDYCTDLAQMT